MKQCSKCKAFKDLNNFSDRKNVGKLNKQSACKECYKNIRIERMKDPEYRKQQCDISIKWKKENNYKYSSEQNRKYFETKKLKYPEKYKARVLANTRNKKPGIHRHHWSYNLDHVKDIIELTKKDHIKLHLFMIYDQGSKYYKTKDSGKLLDSRQKHLDFIISLGIEL